MSPLTEDQIRLIANIVKDELGAQATLEKMREVVHEVAERLERQGPVTFKAATHGRFLTICISPEAPRAATVLSQALKDTGCEITERFETSLAGFFVLLAVIDPNHCGKDIEFLRSKLTDAGNAVGVRIILQAEEALKQA